ncbi:hypothetical protein PF001_g67 [Phytophthora fragariae]|uniref:Uncharacterized protein n=1 Tax=Phytophthora fragariae TaxID=53985 RepID=A0A6A4FBD0_9STRA|nr:hypothetical protein PF001_g67 [Phytophthora fragariae]
MRAPWLAAAQPFQNTAAVDPGLIVGRRRDIRSLLPKSVMSGTPHNGALFEHAVWQCALNSLVAATAIIMRGISNGQL